LIDQGGEGKFRTGIERKVVEDYAKAFVNCPDTIDKKLDNFPKYVRLQALTRFLARYEIFKQVLDVKGSVIECGVFRGFGVMSWANISSILEPVNLTRRIYGFDTFEGFPVVSEKDKSQFNQVRVGDLQAECYDELNEIIKIYDNNRYLGHMRKVELIKGDVSGTIPDFLEHNKHLMVSLLYLDMDLYEPSKIAIQSFLPRMPKNAIIAFDELDNPIWPGETMALLESAGINRFEIKRLEFDPYVGYTRVGSII
jgi:hypothetical protein